MAFVYCRMVFDYGVAAFGVTTRLQWLSDYELQFKLKYHFQVFMFTLSFLRLNCDPDDAQHEQR